MRQVGQGLSGDLECRFGDGRINADNYDRLSESALRLKIGRSGEPRRQAKAADLQDTRYEVISGTALGRRGGIKFE